MSRVMHAYQIIISIQILTFEGLVFQKIIKLLCFYKTGY